MTLSDHVKGVTKIGAGVPTILMAKEEREIVASMQALQEIGFGLTKELVGVVVRDYLKDQEGWPNPFRDGVPGRDNVENMTIFPSLWHHISLP